MLTLHDVAERLKQQSEIDVLEVLGITTEELVDRFLDKIEEKFDELVEELEGEEYDE